jgi:PIN domain nuclease of toxin-antitoxin system
MPVLLDTHAFLWWVDDDSRLSTKARRRIARQSSTPVYVSTASVWEMAIKASLGKLKLTRPIKRFFPEQMAANGFTELAIAFNHTAMVETLPLHHRDPFDRLLACQAIAERLELISRDSVFDAYQRVKRIW